MSNKPKGATIHQNNEIGKIYSNSNGLIHSAQAFANSVSGFNPKRVGSKPHHVLKQYK